MADELNMDSMVDAIGDGLGFSESPNNPDDDFLSDGDLDPDEGLAPLAAKPVAPPAPAVGTAPATPHEQTAPRTWRPEAAAEWAALSPTIKAEIAKREDDIFQGLEASKTHATLGKSFETVLAPFMPTLKQYNMDPVNLTNSLLQAHYTLALGNPEQKAALFQKLAQDYGIALPTAADPDLAPYLDPQVSALQKRNDELKSRLDRIENTQTTATQEREAQTRAQLSQEVDAFASDPAHPYFGEVSEDMLVFLRSGMKLDAAYEKAVWGNPVTRAKEIARTAAEATTKAETERLEKVRKAREASGANLISSARPGRAATPQRGLDKMTDTLAETFKSIQART